MSATPIFRLTLDGKDLSPAFRPRLVSLSLTEKRGSDSDQLSIVLSDDDGRLAIPKEGARLALAMGWASGSAGVTPGLVDKGSFKVDEVSHDGPPDVLTITARAADLTADARIRQQRTRTGKTLGEIIEEIAGRQGLTPRVAPALAGRAVPVLDQGRMSDVALLKFLGRRYDAVATTKAGVLIFAPVGAGTTPGGRPLPTANIDRSDGDRHSWKRAKRDSYSGVTAYWHDPAAAERKSVTSGDASGARRLRKTFGSEADAKAAAESERTRLARGAATLSVTLALGRPDLYPEQRVNLSGWKAPIAGAWLISEAKHELNDRGLTTSLELETPAP